MREVISGEQDSAQQSQNISAHLSVEHESDSYFDSYSWVGIHEEMLKVSLQYTQTALSFMYSTAYAVETL